MLCPNPKSFTTSIHDYLTHKYYVNDVVRGVKEPYFLKRTSMFHLYIRKFYTHLYGMLGTGALIDASQAYAQRDFFREARSFDYHLLFPSRGLVGKYETLLNMIYQLSNTNITNQELAVMARKKKNIDSALLAENIRLTNGLKWLFSNIDPNFIDTNIKYMNLLAQGKVDDFAIADIQNFYKKNQPSLLRNLLDGSVLLRYIDGLDSQRIYFLKINEEKSDLHLNITIGLDCFAERLGLQAKNNNYTLKYIQHLSDLRVKKKINLSQKVKTELKKIADTDHNFVEWLVKKIKFIL